MESLLTKLVENAEQLEKLSQGEISTETLESLQQQQKQIIEKCRLNPIPQHLQPLIDRFHECNNTLITNLTIRRELIKQELYDTKKSRQALQGFKDVYLPAKNKRKRVDEWY